MPLNDALLPVAGETPLLADSAVSAFTRALVTGEEAAWREFHARYAPRLLRYLLVSARGDEERANEVLQLTFLRTVRHMRTFHSEEALWSWLTRLARSALTDEHRRHFRYWAALTRWWSSTPPEPAATREAHAAEELLSRLLTDSVQALPPDERALVEGKYANGESVRALANQTGLTEKAVESRLGRIRQKLKADVLRRLRHADPN